jgi:two-component system, NarL family, response regulator DesR
MGGTPVPAPPAGQHAPHGGSTGQRPVIRVLLAEDVAVVRDTLAALLGLEPDIEVTAALASGDQVVPAALAQRPDVALLDIGLPGTSGLTAAAELARGLPACKVLILTGLQAPGNLDAALRAGARGFLLKDIPSEDLVAAVRAVARGEQVIDPRLADALPDPGQGPGQAR